jgi:hypothetical protein
VDLVVRRNVNRSFGGLCGKVRHLGLFGHEELTFWSKSHGRETHQIGGEAGRLFEASVSYRSGVAGP